GRRGRTRRTPATPRPWSAYPPSVGQRYSWRRRRDGHHVLDAIGTRRAGIDEPRHAIRQTQRRRLLGAGSMGMAVDQPWDDELAARVECLHGLGRGGAQPTPNPVGLWTINGNGFPGVLSIPSLDPP